MTSTTGESSYILQSCSTISQTSRVNPIATTLTSVTFGTGFIFSSTLNSYLLGPNQKSLTVFISPDILSDLDPTGIVILQDLFNDNTTEYNGALVNGKVVFSFNYGLKKAGIHTWVITYLGDDNFAATSLTISVASYSGLKVGHFAVSKSAATIGNNAYFYGPDWATQNNLIINFNGLVLDPTASTCGSTISGVQNNNTFPWVLTLVSM